MYIQLYTHLYICRTISSAVWIRDHLLESCSLRILHAHPPYESVLSGTELNSPDIHTSNPLKHTVPHCNTIKHTATCCNRLQLTVADCTRHGRLCEGLSLCTSLKTLPYLPLAGPREQNTCFAVSSDATSDCDYMSRPPDYHKWYPLTFACYSIHE